MYQAFCKPDLEFIEQVLTAVSQGLTDEYYISQA